MLKRVKHKIQRYLKEYAHKQKFSGSEFHCSVCNSNLRSYVPLPDIYRQNAEKYGFQYFGQNEHLNIKQYSCPFCGSSDRDRFYAAFFKRFELTAETDKRLLHIAPAWKLNNLFLNNHFKVVTTDLMMPDVDYQLNIENMDAFTDNSFDYFICSHVLEHVDNPDVALAELYRILKPGGKGIIMAPVNPNIQTTIEDSTKISKAERIKYFGQEDHLRLFATGDFIERIIKARFNLQMLGKDDFGSESFHKLGLRDSSILYIGNK